MALAGPDFDGGNVAKSSAFCEGILPRQLGDKSSIAPPSRTAYRIPMINVKYDAGWNAVIVEFDGDVDGAQARKTYRDLETLLARLPRGFRLLSDFSAAGTLEPDVECELIKSMDLLNTRGIAEVIRVLPDPDLDIGFNTLSRYHYSKGVRILTVRSRNEANAMMKEHAA